MAQYAAQIPPVFPRLHLYDTSRCKQYHAQATPMPRTGEEPHKVADVRPSPTPGLKRPKWYQNKQE